MPEISSPRGHPRVVPETLVDKYLPVVGREADASGIDAPRACRGPGRGGRPPVPGMILSPSGCTPIRSTPGIPRVVPNTPVDECSPAVCQEAAVVANASTVRSEPNDAVAPPSASQGQRSSRPQMVRSPVQAGTDEFRGRLPGPFAPGGGTAAGRRRGRSMSAPDAERARDAHRRQGGEASTAERMAPEPERESDRLVLGSPLEPGDLQRGPSTTRTMSLNRPPLIPLNVRMRTYG